MNASLHSRRSCVSRARAAATAGARCRTRQLALTCSLSSSVSVRDKMVPASVAPGRSESAARARSCLPVVVVREIARCIVASSPKASIFLSTSSPSCVFSRTKSTSPLAASACAAVLASTNGRNGINTHSAASSWSLWAFFLAAAARKSSSARRASATASGSDACVRCILPRRRTGASPRAATAPSLDAPGGLEKNRDTTFVAEGCDTRGWGRDVRGRREIGFKTCGDRSHGRGEG